MYDSTAAWSDVRRGGDGRADEPFEEVIEEVKEVRIKNDVELNAEEWKEITGRFKELVKSYTGRDFPQDPYEQLELATRAVFNSWFGKRAVDYRNATNISHDLGTAVNIQMVVFGNMGDESGTGVAFTRNPVNGDRNTATISQRPGRRRRRRHSQHLAHQPAQERHA